MTHYGLLATVATVVFAFIGVRVQTPAAVPVIALEHHGPRLLDAARTGMAGSIPGQQAIHLATAVAGQAFGLALRVLFKEGTQVGPVTDINDLIPLQRQNWSGGLDLT